MSKQITDFEKEVVHAGVNLLRAMGRAYGSDSAMLMWETITTAIKPEIKGQILMTMLCVEVGGDITISSIGQTSNYVGLIKCIRTHDSRGLGLKEAKDLVNQLRNYGNTKLVHLTVSSDKAAACRHELRSLGAIVN